MIEINVVLSIFFFVFFSFFDIIVFNEEILLTLCFLAFLFYCFNTLSESIANSFEIRAVKFEQDLLTTFGDSKAVIVNDFNVNMKLQNTISKFSILVNSLINYLAICTSFLEYKSSWIYYQISLTKLNELAVTNNNFILFFQKSCITQLLYAMVLNKSNNDLTFLNTNLKQNKKLSQLKILSFIS